MLWVLLAQKITSSRKRAAEPARSEWINNSDTMKAWAAMQTPVSSFVHAEAVEICLLLLSRCVVGITGQDSQIGIFQASSSKVSQK